MRAVQDHVSTGMIYKQPAQESWEYREPNTWLHIGFLIPPNKRGHFQFCDKYRKCWFYFFMFKATGNHAKDPLGVHCWRLVSKTPLQSPAAVRSWGSCLHLSLPPLKKVSSASLALRLQPTSLGSTALNLISLLLSNNIFIYLYP